MPRPGLSGRAGNAGNRSRSPSGCYGPPRRRRRGPRAVRSRRRDEAGQCAAQRLAELADLARAALPTDAEPTAKPTVPTLKTATQLAAVEFAPRFDVVKDLLPAGLNLIAARPKAGKSMMTLQIGLAATAKSPTTFLRRHVAPGAVLYLPYEDGERGSAHPLPRTRVRIRTRPRPVPVSGKGVAGGRCGRSTCSWNS